MTLRGSAGGLKPSLDETSVAGRLPAAAAEEMPCSCSCKLSVIEFDLAVDDGVVHPFGQLRGIGVGGAVDDFRGIENRNVREIAGFEEAAVLQMLALRGKRGDFADGHFQRQKMLVTHVAAEESGHGAEGAGVGVRLEDRAIEGHLIGVKADTGPGL